MIGGIKYSLECDKWKKAHFYLAKSLYADSTNTAFVKFKYLQQLNISCGQLNNKSASVINKKSNVILDICRG